MGYAKRADYLAYHKRYDKEKRKQHSKASPSQQQKYDMKRYGLTMEGFEAMYVHQAGLCAICGRPPIIGQSLQIDHNHATGKIRGLLCGSCNRAIGLLQDDALVARAAFKYLEERSG